jgi:hypothetical protein
MLGFEQGQDTVGKVATFMVYGWFLLESAKDRFLGVDPPGQHVPLGVWNGTTCSLIRSTSEKCLDQLCREGLSVSPVNRKV